MGHKEGELLAPTEMVAFLCLNDRFVDTAPVEVDVPYRTWVVTAKHAVSFNRVVVYWLHPDGRYEKAPGVRLSQTYNLCNGDCLRMKFSVG